MKKILAVAALPFALTLAACGEQAAEEAPADDMAAEPMPAEEPMPMDTGMPTDPAATGTPMPTDTGTPMPEDTAAPMAE